MTRPHEVFQTFAEYKSRYYPHREKAEDSETPEELGQGLAREWGAGTRAIIQQFLDEEKENQKITNQDADL